MSGQSAAKTTKEVKNVISKIEDNQQLKGGKGSGTETNANGHSGSRPIGGGKYK